MDKPFTELATREELLQCIETLERMLVDEKKLVDSYHHKFWKAEREIADLVYEILHLRKENLALKNCGNCLHKYIDPEDLPCYVCSRGGGVDPDARLLWEPQD